MLNLLSNELRLDGTLDELGVFDPLLDIDSNYFINFIRLRDTKINEFKNSNQRVINYFKNIGILLSHSKKENDKLYRRALQMLDFPEVNGINLGYSNGKFGSGLGPELRRKIIKDAKEIIDSGINEPEIFILVGLFEEGVGPDRLSDMLANLLKDDFIRYTKRINNELGITPENYPTYEFKDNLMINPYKPYPILLLPKNILHELPIAKNWDDIDRVCQENKALRESINIKIGSVWKELTITQKKSFIRKEFIDNPGILKKVINNYRSLKLDEYDFEKDPNGDYLFNKTADNLPNKFPLDDSKNLNTSFEIAELICRKFKKLVEDNGISKLLYYEGKPRREKVAQRLFYLVSDSYCTAHDLDVTPEADGGRGPVDFKMSSGYNDKTVVELKLTTNPRLIHGFEIQIREYSKAENTDKAIYLVIDNGGSEKGLNRLTELYSTKKEEDGCPLLIVVDGVPKKSASKY